jgi:hypothetical protein
MMNPQNDQPSDEETRTHRTFNLDQTEIDFTLEWDRETYHLMRLDAEMPDDRCEHYDDCDEPVAFQVTICDAPELEIGFARLQGQEILQGPDIYLLCRGHAADSMLSFLIRTL